jgi:23S rRNA (cytidine2498-2'-O)-methyltransferase
VLSWIESGAAKNLVVTLKFKGSASPEIVRRYLEIQKAWLFHGFHNKHELTFVWPRPD